MQSKQNKTFEKHSYSLPLSQFHFYLYSLLRYGWLLARKNRFILQKSLCGFPPICIWYMANANMRRDFRIVPYHYFILFYSLRLFIYLLCTVLKAQIKESPRPLRGRHRCGQSRLHDGPQWGRAGFYCPSILLHSIVWPTLPSLSSKIYFWWYFNNLIMPKSCTFSMWIRFISPDFNRSVRIRWHMQLSTFQYRKSFGVKWHKYDSCLSCKCQATQLLPKVRQQLPN